MSSQGRMCPQRGSGGFWNWAKTNEVNETSGGLGTKKDKGSAISQGKKLLVKTRA